MNKELAEELTQAVGQSTAGAWRTIAGLKALGVPKTLGLTEGEWLQKYLGNYIQLAVAERYDAIVAAKEAGLSNRKIAAAAGVSEGTIRNDLRAQPATRRGRKIQKKPRNSDAAAQSATHPLTELAAVANCFRASAFPVHRARFQTAIDRHPLHHRSLFDGI